MKHKVSEQLAAFIIELERISREHGFLVVHGHSDDPNLEPMSPEDRATPEAGYMISMALAWDGVHEIGAFVQWLGPSDEIDWNRPVCREGIVK